MTSSKNKRWYSGNNVADETSTLIAIDKNSNSIDRKEKVDDDVLVPVDADNDDNDDDDEYPTDIFTMMSFASKPNSRPFIYGLLVFSIQMIILTSIVLDLTNDTDSRISDEQDNNDYYNILNVPPNVPILVRIAQVIAISIACLSNTDVTESIEVLTIGWRSTYAMNIPGATRMRFILANSLRIVEGSYVIIVSFVQIVQCNTVLDIFLNFAAVEFVAGLDNIAYRLARGGWLGSPMKKYTLCIEKMKLSSSNRAKSIMNRKRLEYIKFIKPTLVVGLLTILYAMFGFIAYSQTSGEVLKKTSCKVVEVTFGEQVYSLTNDKISFEKLDRIEYYKNDSATTTKDDDDDDGDEYIETDYYYNYRKDTIQTLYGSNRVLSPSFSVSNPPDLHYAYFSGMYNADFNQLIESRPIYVENGFHDITSGMFYYCNIEKSWVFTIPAVTIAFYKTHPEYDTNKRCIYGWLMRSPITLAFNLDEAPNTGWKVWTGILEPAVPGFDVLCTECNNDFDCGTTYRGTCNNDDNHCTCTDIAEGTFCNQKIACNEVIPFIARDPKQRVYEKMNKGTYKNIRQKLLNKDATIHGRPAYYRNVRSDDSRNSNFDYEVLFYTGRRWYGAFFNLWQFPINAKNTLVKQDFFNRFHAYWDSVLVWNVQSISEPTDHYMPTGSIKWYNLYQSKSIGNLGGAFPVNAYYPQRYECALVDCNIHRVCGLYGSCMNGTCICDVGFYGHYCECNYWSCRSTYEPTPTIINIR